MLKYCQFQNEKKINLFYIKNSEYLILIKEVTQIKTEKQVLTRLFIRKNLQKASNIIFNN